MRRCHLVLLVISIVASMGAQHRTPNFVVDADDPQVAQLVGKWAEYYRRDKAILWLGQEMPTWQQPCPLRVIVTMELPKGETSFNFFPSLTMVMKIEGRLDRLIASVLPHEITHTIFAYHFRCPLPRWADEGGSVLSEDQAERERHDQLTRNILNSGQQYSVRQLIGMKQYPEHLNKVMCLYAQGYSLADYLVKRQDNRTFLAFIGEGMHSNWDSAVQTYYGHRSVEEMEQAWLKNLRDTKKRPPVTEFAQNTTRPQEHTKSSIFVRTTVPSVQPLDPVALYRGASPNNESDPFSKQNSDRQPFQTPPILVQTAPSTGWQPGPGTPYPAPVQLGQPQFNQTQFMQPQFSYPQYFVPQYGSCPNCVPH